MKRIAVGGGSRLAGDAQRVLQFLGDREVLGSLGDLIIAARSVRDRHGANTNVDIFAVGKRVFGGSNLFIPIQRLDCIPARLDGGAGVLVAVRRDGDGRRDRLAADDHGFGGNSRLSIVCCRNRSREGVGPGVEGRSIPGEPYIVKGRAGNGEITCCRSANLLAVVGFVRVVAAVERDCWLGLGNGPRHGGSGGGKPVIACVRPSQGDSAGGDRIRLIHIGAVIGNIRRLSGYALSADNIGQREG